MSEQFFITGLPRSRTAWFANLFTWGDSVCHHDFLSGFMGSHVVAKMAFVSLLKEGRYSHVGHSCSSNLLMIEELMEVFPKAKWVILSRDVDRVYESCSSILGVSLDRLKEMENSLDDLRVATNAHVVPVDSLSFSDIEHMSDFLGIPVGPPERIRMLLDMNIQIHPPVLRERLRALNVSTIVDTEEAA